MEVKLLVQFGINTKNLNIRQPVTENILKEAIASRFELSNTNFTIQYYDEEWKAYIDIDDYCNVADRTKLKCFTVDDFRISGNQTTPRSTSCISSEENTPISVSAVPRIVNDWPDKFQFPVAKLVEKLKDALDNSVDLTLPKNRYLRGLLLNTLCDEAVKFKSHPNCYEKQELAKCIVSTWPHLKESIGRGYDGWLSSIVDCLKAKRRALGIVDESRSKIVRKRKLTVSNSPMGLPPLSNSSTVNVLEPANVAVLKPNVACRAASTLAPSSSGSSKNCFPLADPMSNKEFDALNAGTHDDSEQVASTLASSSSGSSKNCFPLADSMSNKEFGALSAGAHDFSGQIASTLAPSSSGSSKNSFPLADSMSNNEFGALNAGAHDFFGQVASTLVPSSSGSSKNCFPLADSMSNNEFGALNVGAHDFFGQVASTLGPSSSGSSKNCFPLADSMSNNEFGALNVGAHDDSEQVASTLAPSSSGSSKNCFPVPLADSMSNNVFGALNEGTHDVSGQVTSTLAPSSSGSSKNSLPLIDSSSANESVTLLPQKRVLRYKKNDKCDTSATAGASSKALDEKYDETMNEMKIEWMKSETSRDMNKVIRLLQSTYNNRRLLIHQKTSFVDIENAYPALFCKEGIVNEYSMVTGSAHTVRMSRMKLLEKGPTIVEMAESMLPDVSRANSKKLTGKQTAIKLVLDSLKLDSCSDVDDLHYRRAMAGMMLVPILLGDNAGLVYKIYEETVAPSDFKVLLTSNQCPHVAYIGSPLRHNCRSYVCVEGKPVICGKDSFDAMALAYMMYYSLWIDYPKAAASTYQYFHFELFGQNDGQKSAKLAKFLAIGNTNSAASCVEVKVPDLKVHNN